MVYRYIVHKSLLNFKGVLLGISCAYITSLLREASRRQSIAWHRDSRGSLPVRTYKLCFWCAFAMLIKIGHR